MPNRASERARLDSRFDELWPIPRSITGDGFRKSLEILQKDVPLEVESVPSGTEIFDWKVPPEWRIHEARLTGPNGEIYADFDATNLAVVNYSEPVDEYMSLDELDPHLHTLPNLPEATPYVTSYYDREWGFCLPYQIYETLPEGEYHAYIDSELVEGELTYGHTVLDGRSEREILLNTYLCHPSLANNELSGPLVLTSLYKRLANWNHRKFKYRFVVIPETIGSLVYLSRYGDHLQENLLGGLALTCLGGPKENLSYKMTRRGNTLLDDLIKHVDAFMGHDFRFRRFDPTTGSDERQYCSPGFNLPVGQFARTIYLEYDEYHNSNDTKEFMGIDPLIDSAETIEDVLRSLEYAGYYMNKEPYGEPMLSKRDIYPTVNSPEMRSKCHDGEPIGVYPNDESEFVDKALTLLNYSEGDHSVIEISEQLNVSIEEMVPVIDRLCDVDLLEPVNHTLEYQNNFD